MKNMLLRFWSPAATRYAAVRASHILSRAIYNSVGQRRRPQQFESMDVQCGSSGTIKIDIYNSQVLLQNLDAPIVVYLPPTGQHRSHHHPPIPPYLFSPSAALARINYRWNENQSSATAPYYTPSSDSSQQKHAFPTPLHDILHAWTYLLDHISAISSRALQARKRTAMTRPSPTPSQRPFLIYGSFLGGTLATTLALTENFTSRQHPVKIIGVIAMDGIYDWVNIRTCEVAARSVVEQSSSGGDMEEEDCVRSVWGAETLIRLRDHLFSTPASCFDAFASPTLFFRTPGIAVPRTWNDVTVTPSPNPSASPSPNATSDQSLVPVTDIYSARPSEISPSASQERMYEIKTQLGEHTGPVSARAHLRAGQMYADAVTLAPRNHLKFPPVLMGLQIPRALFLYSSRAAAPHTQIQADELARLMQRSVRLHELKEREYWDEGLDKEAMIGERVRCRCLGGEQGEQKEEEAMVREWINEGLGCTFD